MRGSVRKDGSSWMFVVDLPRGLEGARRQQKRRGFTTKRAAEIALAEALQRANSGSFVEPSKLTVGEFLVGQWLPTVESNLRPSTFASYAGNIERHVAPAIGTVRLQTLTAPMLTSLYNRLISEKGLAPKTVRHVHTTLRKALSDAMRWGLIERNSASLADPPRVHRAEMKVWTADEVKSFLRFVADDPLAGVFTLLATTGMRRGEVLGLRWCDVDFEHRRLRIQQTLTSVDYKLVWGQPKTNRSRRVIPIDHHVAAMLATQQALLRTWRKECGAGWGDLDLVFCKPDGSPIHPDATSDTFDRRVRASGLPKIRLHDLRHTYASVALSIGVPVKVVSEVLGHSTTAFTMDVYSHVMPSQLEDLARAISQLENWRLGFDEIIDCALEFQEDVPTIA
jgi:integrase